MDQIKKSSDIVVIEYWMQLLPSFPTDDLSFFENETISRIDVS